MTKYVFGRSFLLGNIIFLTIMLVNLPVVSSAYRSSRKYVAKIVLEVVFLKK